MLLYPNKGTGARPGREVAFIAANSDSRSRSGLALPASLRARAREGSATRWSSFLASKVAIYGKRGIRIVVVINAPETREMLPPRNFAQCDSQAVSCRQAL